MDPVDRIRELLPIKEIYEDAAKPTVKELGEALRDVTKAGRLLLAPLEFLAAQHDKWQHYLQRLSAKVSDSDKIEVSPEISGPALEALRYVNDETLVEMYLNLLARAMDRHRVNQAHPAFVEIIKQLSPDEGLILIKLKKSTYHFKRKIRLPSKNDGSGNYEIGDLEEMILYNEFPVAELKFPEKFFMYVDHLSNLHILKTWPVETKKTDDEGFSEDKRELRYTQFGVLFCQACVPDEIPASMIVSKTNVDKNI